MPNNKNWILDRPEWEWSITKMALNLIARLTGQKTNPEKLQQNLQKLRFKNENRRP